jgi:hypothetical protein
MVPKKKEMAATSGRRGYALQMSKSSDSITAAKLLARARAEQRNETGGGLAFDGRGGLRINKNFSKSIEQQIDVYSKTREEIQMILMLAKSSSVNDRIALFSNLMNKPPDQSNNDLVSKADRIRREIEEARAAQQQQEATVVSDTEIEFQEPIESKVKPLKIPMKPKLLGKAESTTSVMPSSPATGLRINRPSVPSDHGLSFPTIKNNTNNNLLPRELENKDDASPKSILVKKVSDIQRTEKERSRSPKKKTPRLLSDHLLSPNNSFQIYAQSATDMSATEDESESAWAKKRNNNPESESIRQDKEPNHLQVPNRPAQDLVRTGIMKSKSFASPYECYLDDTDVTAKKLTMMAFFGHDVSGKNSTVSSINSKQNVSKESHSEDLWADGVDDEEDDGLVDVDAEFESLLNRTFEQETLLLSQRTGIDGKDNAEQSRLKNGGTNCKAVGQKSEKAVVRSAGRGGGESEGGPVNTASVVGERELRSLHHSSTCSHQPSSNVISSTSSDGAGKEISKMNLQMLRQKGFDPLAALPTSQSKQYAARRPPPHSPLGDGHSPSPTQSEYDTCDPWDES